MKAITWFCTVFFFFLSFLITAQPIVNLGTDTTICGGTLVLDASNSGATFLWSTGAVSQTITVDSSAVYWVDVTDINGTTRDSIVVTVLQQPSFLISPQDTSLCRGVYDLVASSDTGVVVWLDSMGQILGLGDSLSYSVDDTSRLWYEARRYALYGGGVGLSSSTVGTGYISVPRGINFTAHDILRLNKVSLDIQLGTGPFVGDIELENSQGQVIAQKAISYATGGIHEVDLDFDVLPGTYTLYLRNIIGGTSKFNNPVNWNAQIYPFISLTGGAPFAVVYAYFYDWKVSVLSSYCSSGQDSVELRMLPTPVVDLGNDTTLCQDSLLLDATNTGSSFDYVWHTGAITNTLMATTTDLYKVTVSVGGDCAVEDSIMVSVLSPPVFTAQPQDTSLCRGVYDFVASSDTGVVVWLDSMGQVLGLGDSLSYSVNDTSRLWYEARRYTLHGGGVGLSSSTVATGYINTARGINFTAHDILRLNKVSLDIQLGTGPFVGDIELENSQGQVIAQKAISYATGGIHEVDLDFDVLPGTYTLYLRNITGGTSKFNNPVNWNAQTYPFISLTGGAPFAVVYAYFYDWKVSVLSSYCSSGQDSVELRMLPTPVVDLGNDTTLCQDSLLLDATNTGSSFDYVWHTGAITNTLMATTTDLYKVTVSVGGDCAVEDSIMVSVLSPPVFTTQPQDTSLCRGVYDLVASSDTGVVVWLDSMGQVLGLGDSLSYRLEDTSRLWYEARRYTLYGGSIGLSSSTVGTGYISVPRGINFTAHDIVRLNKVSLDIQLGTGPFVGDIELENSQGQVIAQKAISYATGGIHEVDLDFDVLPGTYTLYLRNITGGTSKFNNPVNWNAQTYPFISLTGGAPFATVYAYFYDWEVSILNSYCSSGQDSVELRMLPTPIVDLGNDTTLCQDSLLLDVTNAGSGYNYVWHTGAITSTLMATTTDLYKVTVSVGGDCAIEDSIMVSVLSPPVLTAQPQDASLCRGVYDLVASSDTGVVVWLDSMGQVLGLGDSLSYRLEDTSRLWYEARRYELYEGNIGLSSSTVATGYIDVERGINFTAHDIVRLNKVSLDIQLGTGPFVGDIELENSQGQVIAQKAISYAIGGIHKVDLDFDVLPGTYTLYLRNISGGTSKFNNPVNWNTQTYPFISLTGGAPFAVVYAYFYDWEVSILNSYCSSGQDSVELKMLPTPIIDLNVDTFVCGDTLILDVFYPNASYDWGATGVTTSDITITQEGTYYVTSTINSCAVSDSTTVYLTSNPTVNIISADTITCAGLITRMASGGDVIKWYDEPVGGNYLGQGAFFMYDAQASDTLWASGHNFASKCYTQGLTSTYLAPQTRYFYLVAGQVRGLSFDVHEDLYLKDVTMYLGNQAPLTGQIQLWDANDNLIDSIWISIGIPGANVVPIGFNIPRGQNYKLVLTDFSIAELLSEYPYSNFPVTGDYVTINSGVPFTSVYQYFYNWNVQTLSCASSRQPSVVTVLPTPNITFPVDTVICGDTLMLDASTFGATTYNWSTGATSASVAIDSSQMVSLLATNGICTDYDSINVFVVEPPSSVIPPNDTTICQGSNTLLRVAGNASYYAWYDSLSSTAPFALGDSININLQDSTTLWVEGIGFIPKSTPVGAIYDPSSNLNVWGTPQNSTTPTRGMEFNVNSAIILNSVAIYVDTATTATLTIYKSQFPYYTKNINLGNVGENIVQIDTLLEAGNYTILLGNKSSGKILSLSPYTNLSQLNTPEITFLGAVPSVLSQQYVYFFNWRISTPSCATSRFPVEVAVVPTPEITMVADTATCTLSNIVLDPILVNSPSYSYLWNNTSTDDTLMVTTSGYYQVTVVNDGICAATQDVYVQFLNTPVGATVNDFSICAPQVVNIPVPINDGIVVWYDSSDLNNINYLTAPYDTYVGDTTDFWFDIAPKATTRIGKQQYSNPTESSAYRNVIIANTFDVHEYAILDSVAVYVAAAPTVLSVELMDNQGNILRTVNYTIQEAQKKVFIPLDFLIAPGNGYQLSFSSINNLFLVDRTPVSQPTSNAGIATLTGTTLSGVEYTYFFDWHFSYAYPACHANADTFTISVNMPVDLPDSSYTCDSLLVDAQHPNVFSYQWSNGLTTGIATFHSAGTYTLTMTDGASCTVVDTIIVMQPMPVGLPVGNAVCDYHLGTNYTLADASFSWSTGDSTSFITVPSTGIYSVTVTTNGGCVLVDTAYISQIVSAPMPNLGTNINACYADTLDAGYGGQGMQYAWNTGDTTQQIIVNTAGFYTVTVTHPLGCSGTDYVSVAIDTAPQASFTVTKNGLTILANNNSTASQTGANYWWDMGDGSTYTIPNPFHTYADSGCYRVTLIVSDACGADTSILKVAVGVPDSCTVGIDRIANVLENIGFQIVPNPNAGNFQLQLSGSLKESTQLQLYDLNGRLVYQKALPLSSQQDWDIQIPDLTTGVYFLRLLNKQQTQTKRVVILRE